MFKPVFFEATSHLLQKSSILLKTICSSLKIDPTGDQHDMDEQVGLRIPNSTRLVTFQKNFRIFYLTKLWLDLLDILSVTSFEVQSYNHSVL